MTPNQIHNLLEKAWKSRLSILVEGQPGIGKSDVGDQVAAALGYDMEVWHLSTMEAVDIRGLPSADKENEMAKWVPYEEQYRLIYADKPLVLHLEDVGQARLDVQAAVMHMFTRNTIGGKPISPNVIKFGTTNGTKDSAGVTGMIEPLKSRWHSIVNMETDASTWPVWALDHGMPAELVSYIRNNPDRLHQFKPTKDLTNSPCPRSWHHVGDLLNAGISDLDAITGAVGQGEALQFKAYLEWLSKLPDLDMIAADPMGAPLVDNISATYAVITGAAGRADRHTFAAFLEYAKRLDKPFEVLFIFDAYRRKAAEITVSPAFSRWCMDKRNQELWAETQRKAGTK